MLKNFLNKSGKYYKFSKLQIKLTLLITLLQKILKIFFKNMIKI